MGTRAGTSNIDRPRSPFWPACSPWPSSGLGAAILGALYLAGADRNLLYLSMLLSAAIMMSVAFRRWRTVLPGLGLCAYLACVPVSVVDLGAPYPAPHNRPGTEGLWVTELPPGEVWTYRFPLRDLRESGEGAAPAGFLYIDGRDLSGLVVEVQGNARTASERIGTKNGFDHLSIPLGDERAAVLTVALHGAGRNTPRIYHGPEVHGFSVYGDAVWLEFTGSRNRIIYHAMRGVAKTGAH